MSRPAMAACERCHTSVFSRSGRAANWSAYTWTTDASSICSRRYLRLLSAGAGAAAGGGAVSRLELQATVVARRSVHESRRYRMNPSLARRGAAWYHPRPMHYLLMYDVVHDYVERRAQYRSEHIGLAREAVA